MSDIAELTLPEPIFFGPTFDAVPGAELDIENVHYTQSDSDEVQYVFFLWVTNCSFDEFDAAMTNDPTLAEWSRLVEFDDRVLYRVATPEHEASETPLIYPLTRRHDVTILETHRDADGFHLRVRAPSRNALRAFQRDLTDRGAAVDVGRITSEARSDPEACAITEKQWEALTLAYERGYFATPKQVTLTELAEEFGATRQTLSHHVRSAVEFLVERAIDAHAQPSVVEESA